MDNKRQVKDFYLERELKKSGVKVTDGNVKENLRVIDCCEIWDLDQVLSGNDFLDLVTVICPESEALIRDGRRSGAALARF